MKELEKALSEYDEAFQYSDDKLVYTKGVFQKVKIKQLVDLLWRDNSIKIKKLFKKYKINIKYFGK